MFCNGGKSKLKMGTWAKIYYQELQPCMIASDYYNEILDRDRFNLEFLKFVRSMIRSKV